MSIFSQTGRLLSTRRIALLSQLGYNFGQSSHRQYVEPVRLKKCKLLLTSGGPCFRNLSFLNHTNRLCNSSSQYCGGNNNKHHSGANLIGRRKNYHNHNDNFRDLNLKPLITMFGLIGLFKGSSGQGLEEDRSKLTDEEKMKKMKPVEIKIAKGVLSMCDQEYTKANELFHEALGIAQKEDDEERETLILNLLASNYFESGDLQKAEKLFIDLMKRMIASGVGETSPPILELSLKLASIYSKDPECHNKALKGFKFVINSLLLDLQEVLKPNEELDIQNLSEEKRDKLALLGWSYDWFAKHLLLMNDYNGAADMLQRALQISSKILGPLHDQTLILLNDVGTTLAMNDSPQEGRTFIKKAVEGAIESQSHELASFYVNLGLVELKLKRLEKAKRFCEYSAELASKNREHHSSHEVIELSRSCLNEVQRLFEFQEQ